MREVLTQEQYFPNFNMFVYLVNISYKCRLGRVLSTDELTVPTQATCLWSVESKSSVDKKDFYHRN